MPKPGLEARAATTRLLHQVLMEGSMLGQVTDASSGPMEGLAPNEKARALSLAHTVLRHMARLDAVIEAFVPKAPPLNVLNILRVAAAELLIDGIAAHAVVDAAVTLTKQKRKIAHLSGLVNAVSRKIDREGAEILAEMPAQPLPPSLRRPIAAQYGEQVAGAIETAHMVPPPTDLTLKDPAKLEALAKALSAEVLPTGSLRLARAGQLTSLEGFETGDWWVQDAAAAIPARCLDIANGANVLDLCAAPGGKTMQLSSMGGNVTAIDSSKPRLKRVRENLKRTGLAAEVLTADVLKWNAPIQYDAILLDAPCSASGTIRRHPDLPHLRKNLDLAPLTKLQHDMLKRAAGWLKEGGQLVYATCSLFGAEGESTAAWISENLPELSPVPLGAESLGLPAEVATKSGALRLRPDFWQHLGGMDGFYIAKYTRLT